MSQADDIVIRAEHLSKKFCKSVRRSMLYGIRDLVRAGLGLALRPETLRPDEFWAVDDLSFESHRGEVLGIMGPNGSGKTTLLKMLSGIYRPDRGTAVVRGRVGSLIDIGAGFHPLLTGRENIYLNCSILGLTKSEIDARFESIVEFAGIGDFLDTQVKHYSSGMFLRLGFSCMANSDADILILDETFAVGDLYFQQKCFRRIAELRRKSKTILLVAHDMHTIRTLCDSALLLDVGKKIWQGPPGQVIDHYLGVTHIRLHLGPAPVRVTFGRSDPETVTAQETVLTIGTSEVELRSLQIINHLEIAGAAVTRNHRFKVVFEVASTKDLADPHYGVAFFNQRALQIYSANTYTLGLQTQPVRAGETVRVEYEFECLLVPGPYTISIGVANKGIDRFNFLFEEYLLSKQDVASFEVVGSIDDAHYSGIFDMRPKVIVNRVASSKEG